MAYFYKVLFPLATKDGFIYESNKKIDVGFRVLVPFRGKEKIGIVWEIVDEKPQHETKDIISVLDKTIVVDAFLKKTIDFASNYYLTFKGLMLKSALPKRIFEKTDEIDLSIRKPETIYASCGHTLNEEQAAIYNSINQHEFNVNLIFGVTGSGKTEVYIKIIEDVLKSNKQAVVLVPEIVLTPQYIDIFSERFGSDFISVIHSRLTPKARFDNWLQFYKGQTAILIGTRSAVFSKFSNVGVVVVDEENDESYKQENEPRYNAKDIAIYRAKQHNIPIILCSATPTLETYYKATVGKFKMFRLRKRIKDIPLPKVEVVKITKNEILSDITVKKIEETLNNKKTVAILANRRGYSNYVVCGDCGHLFMCPNCSVSLTYHKKTNDMKCHWCEANFPIPSKCPKCQSNNIITIGIGSQQVEEFLIDIFKDKRIERFDRDSVLTKKEFDRITTSLRNGEIDILVGTQMLSKGHDISKIGLVVVTSIEELFSIPDFRSKEKALSLIIQTAGRSGRQNEGEVIVQTLSEENDLIQYIKNHNYELFLEKEIKERKMFLYPPFSRLIRIIIEHKNKAKAQNAANRIAEILNGNVKFLGPSACPIFKLRNRHRFHILIKTNDIFNTISFIRKNIVDFKENIHFDVDPISFF